MEAAVAVGFQLHENLLPPSNKIKRRIHAVVLLEGLENVLGWLVLASFGIILASADGKWLRVGVVRVAIGIFLVEVAMKVTRKFVDDYFVRNVPCSFVMLQLAQGRSHHGYLRAVGILRLAGILAQATLSALMAYQFHTQANRPSDGKAILRRLDQLVHFGYATVFSQILVSLVIFVLTPFSTLHYIFVMALKRMAAARRHRIRVLPLRGGGGVGVGVGLGGVGGGEDGDEGGGGADNSQQQQQNVAVRPQQQQQQEQGGGGDDDEEDRTVGELPALVWYFHCHRHPKLPPVFAFRKEDCNCGLPGHWFLGLTQLIGIALSRNTEDGVSAISTFQEMALDALGRIVQTGNPLSCDLIVDNDHFGIDRIVNIISDHTSIRCREKAVVVVWHLANMSRLADAAAEHGERLYDPLRSVTSSPRLAKTGMVLLDAALRKSSTLVQEKAVGALWRLCRNHRMVTECLFSGTEGKTRIEELVDLAAHGATSRTCLDALYLLSRLMADCAAPYAHYTQLREIRDFRGVLVGTTPRLGRRREPVRGIEGYRGPQRFWVSPARAAFRESRALPRLIGLALSHNCSNDARELIAVILQCYHELGAVNLFPFEAKELVRILQIRYYTTAPELLYTAMLICDLLLTFFDDRESANTEDFLPRLIENDDSMLFVHLLRLQVEQWMGPKFAVKESIERIAVSACWRQFIGPLSQPPTVRHLFRAPARLMAYLLAAHFELLTVEIEEVVLDDQATRRGAAIDDDNRDEGPVAGISVAAFWLVALLHVGESVKTKLNACVALTRLATHDCHNLRPYVVEAFKYLLKENEVNLEGIEDAPEFLELRTELREGLPDLGNAAEQVPVSSSEMSAP